MDSDSHFIEEVEVPNCTVTKNTGNWQAFPVNKKDPASLVLLGRSLLYISMRGAVGARKRNQFFNFVFFEIKKWDRGADYPLFSGV